MIFSIERTPRKIYTRWQEDIEIQGWEPGESHYFIDGVEVDVETYDRCWVERGKEKELDEN